MSRRHARTTPPPFAPDGTAEAVTVQDVRASVGHAVLAAVCIAALAAGCTQTSAGAGGFARSTATPAGTASGAGPGGSPSPGRPRPTATGSRGRGSPHPSGSPASGSPTPGRGRHPSGTARPTGSGSPAPPSGRARLSCAGSPVERPAGAPYCYGLPFGFQRATRARLGTARWVTAVGLGTHDAIATGVFRAPANTDVLSDRELRSANDTVVHRELAPSVTLRSGTGRRLRVDGARALEYHGVPRDAPTTQIDYYFIFRGHTKLQVNCEWTSRGAAVRKACSRLLDSLQVVSIS